ncbi:MAG: nitrogenase molybdenum-iron protein subunit beta [Clostridium sp.]|uniref:nitrogenase molybdenum-iron protein subunit beta n=1 Tax=Clostridium sp. TaxID=1506 RepID=UPI0025C6A2DC|nr:nitrogenase molybdenum-iron protein subunit beta [Clostridium sp.]MCE5221371.1 nitrogenase molybdenum-iron protein subunit beta [Clostridium sp.]
MLDLTPKEIKERTAITINPSKTCQPVGAMYAALGVHGCMPHSHGSQGCCSYHRTVLSRHFKEPAIATSSSFSEGACVFGGGSNIKTAVKNIFDMYDPEIIAVHTTCLSETIGDDLNAFIEDINIPDGKRVIYANTPSYVGSHITGFSNMVVGFVNKLAKTTGVKNGKMCVIPGFINPGDMREVKKLLKLMGVDYTMLPDTTGVFDAPMTGKYDMYPKGGTKIQDIIELGDCEKTLALGSFASEAGASALEKLYKVSYTTLNMPIGIGSTDDLIMELSKFSKQQVPYELEEERGQLVDIMVDSHQYYDGKKVALYGDPDILIALSKFLLELGMIPKYVITGTPSNVFEKQMKALYEEFGVEGCIAKQNADLFELHQLIKNEPVDLLMGGTHGKYIARAEDIPLVRVGFPVLDRYIHAYMPTVGYKGAMRLLELMLGALMDRQDRDAKEEDFELVM